MRITPLDVRKQEFRKGMRGLDPEEVYAFLATVADEYETVLTDNRQLRDRVLELDEKVTEYRNMEKTLRDTLLTAERVMNEARENARKEAELILRDARVQAQQASQTSAREAETLRAQLRELRSLRDRYLARLRSLAESQIGMLENFLQDFEEDDHRARELESTGPYAAEAPVPSAAPAPESATGPAPAEAAPQGFKAEEGPGMTDSPSPEDPPAQMSLPETAEGLASDAAPETPGGRETTDDPDSGNDQWRHYQPGLSEASRPVETVAATVAEMAEAAGSESGQSAETMPPSPDPGEEAVASEWDGSPREEPAIVASTEETEESAKESRWSISRFTRGLGDF